MRKNEINNHLTNTEQFITYLSNPEFSSFPSFSLLSPLEIRLAIIEIRSKSFQESLSRITKYDLEDYSADQLTTLEMNHTRILKLLSEELEKISKDSSASQLIPVQNSMDRDDEKLSHTPEYLKLFDIVSKVSKKISEWGSRKAWESTKSKESKKPREASESIALIKAWQKNTTSTLTLTEPEEIALKKIDTLFSKGIESAKNSSSSGITDFFELLPKAIDEAIAVFKSSNPHSQMISDLQSFKSIDMDNCMDLYFDSECTPYEYLIKFLPEAQKNIPGLKNSPSSLKRKRQLAFGLNELIKNTQQEDEKQIDSSQPDLKIDSPSLKPTFWRSSSGSGGLTGKNDKQKTSSSKKSNKKMKYTPSTEKNRQPASSPQKKITSKDSKALKEFKDKYSQALEKHLLIKEKQASLNTQGKVSKNTVKDYLPFSLWKNSASKSVSNQVSDLNRSSTNEPSRKIRFLTVVQLSNLQWYEVIPKENTLFIHHLPNDKNTLYKKNFWEVYDRKKHGILLNDPEIIKYSAYITRRSNPGPIADRNNRNFLTTSQILDLGVSINMNPPKPDDPEFSSVVGKKRP